MPVIQIVLLLVVLGGLGLLVAQNLSPILPIVFLGMKTQALPVAMWIMLAIALGFFTSAFLQLLNYLQRRPLLARIRQLEAQQRTSTSARSESSQTTSRQTSYTPPPQQSTPTNDDASDWDAEESEEDEDWDIDEEPETTSRKDPRDARNYEVKQEPKTSTVTGSVYSYGYREPQDSGVGRTEAVYDANYRVITPPYHEPSKNQEEEEDDWGFEDDEEDEDRDRSEEWR